MRRILSVNRTVRFSDIIPPTPFEIENRRKLLLIELGQERKYDEMSASEIEKYFAYRYEKVLLELAVDREMDRLGFTKSNELTARSTTLTAQDYATTVTR